MNNQYVCYHLHSDLSNGITNVDSVTKFSEYIELAKTLGMNALGFSEHGSVFEWWHKKQEVEKAGLKFLYAVEAYLTSTLDEKIRDNYHCVLIAKNYDGFREINRLLSQSFNRNDNHFYYVPRISFDELFNTSDNIIVTSACIGGALYKGTESDKDKFLQFYIQNKERCFLEIQHHKDAQQVKHNKELANLSITYGLNLIAGTDTHALNATHVSGRKILQKSKNVNFPDEDGWDLTFKSYDELCAAYRDQNAISESQWLTAIQNTNVMASMVEKFKIDTSPKYPKLYDNAEQIFNEHIKIKREKHPYVNDRYPQSQLDKIIEEEVAVYKKTQSIDFMLLQEYLRDWEISKGIQCGYSRGSVSGSLVAYILGITEMDSIKFDLNFFRFQNPSRVSLCDIDTDYGSKDRDVVKRFLLEDHMGYNHLYSSEIITFNTIALKGAIRDVGRALEIPLQEVDAIAKQCDTEDDLERLRIKYPELFKYVDIVNGTIVSVGTHPSGVLVSDINIAEEIGLCSTSASDYQISMLNMKELDDLMMIKLDILGLDNIAVVNETCKAVGIDRLTPDNTDLDDMNVWKSIREDTTGIFQWESASAQAYLKQFMSDRTLDIVRKLSDNFSLIKWFSFGNGLIRPACASYRNSVANGDFYDNGLKELNEFLKPTLGHVTMQEDIMQFLVVFCGYSQADSDIVRRAIGKKRNTESLLPEIEERFISHTSKTYNIPEEQCAEIIKPFLQIIVDASSYAFSWNHSDSYSCLGYICGYLRYYYPLEYITASLNTFIDNEEKTVAVTKYARKQKINISSVKFRHSKSTYNFDKATNTIYKGMASIKYMNAEVSDRLYSFKDNQYSSFVELLTQITNDTSLNSKQLDILIKLDYFSEFGNSKELLRILDIYNLLKQGKAKQLPKDKIPTDVYEEVKEYLNGYKKDGGLAKSYSIVDMPKLLVSLESYIRKLNLSDLDYKNKIQTQFDYLGYVDIQTDKEEDRPKLFIKDIFPAKRKSDGKQFGYNILTRSIGSGIESRFTIFNKVFNNEPIEKNDIIYCKRYTRDGQYFTIHSYEKII